MKRNSLFLSGILICAAVSAVRADEASKTAKVEEFFKVSHTEQILTQGMAMMLSQAKSGMIQKMLDVTPTPEQAKANDELQDKLAAILTRTLSWEKLKPAYVKLYAGAYTEEELDGIVAFYKSPAGQALISNSPSIMAKANEIVQQQLASAMPEIQKLMRDAEAPKK
jgi:uncharacterized protein